MNGRAGYCPRWYLTMRAARYLGTVPWGDARVGLEDVSILWRQRALMAESAEAWAEAERARRRR